MSEPIAIISGLAYLNLENTENYKNGAYRTRKFFGCSVIMPVARKSYGFYGDSLFFRELLPHVAPVGGDVIQAQETPALPVDFPCHISVRRRDLLPFSYLLHLFPPHPEYLFS